MTDNTHPITPPPELVQEWREEAAHRQYSVSETEDYLIEQAAQYSADRELEACCEVLAELICDGRLVLAGGLICDGGGVATDLRAIRRPKPPSLKEQALQALDLLKADATTHGLGFDSSTIRRAIESLPD